MQRFSLIALLALVALVIASASASGLASSSNDVYIGHREADDSLVERKAVDVNSTWLTTKNKEITISGSGRYIITRVEAIDIKRKPTSAKVHVISGGPGQTFVSLGFRSASGHGIHYVVRVYGKRVY